jgi:hypothetical protein
MKTVNLGLFSGSLAFVLVAQLGCSDDGPGWNLPARDAGLDGGEQVTANPVTEGDAMVQTSASPNSSTDEISVSLDPNETLGSSDEPDASASSNGGTSGEPTSSPVEAGVSSSPTGTTLETSSASYTSEPDAALSEVTSDGTSDVASDVTSASDTLPVTSDSITCDGGVCSETTTDAAAPGLTVCGYQIDEANGIALGDVLPEYLAGMDAGAGDAGGASSCYPPCIMALLEACPVVSECTPETYTTACWANGTAQVQEFIEGETSYVSTETAYRETAPCIQGTSVLNLETSEVALTWRDGTGALVATGVRTDGDLFVTCEYDEQTYLADPTACPWLGEAVYDQTSCY